MALCFTPSQYNLSKHVHTRCPSINGDLIEARSSDVAAVFLSVHSDCQAYTPYNDRLVPRCAVRLLQVPVRGFLSQKCENLPRQSRVVFYLLFGDSYMPPLTPLLVPNLETVGVGVTPVQTTRSLLEGMERDRRGVTRALPCSTEQTSSLCLPS